MAINPYDTYLNIRGLGSFQELINDLAGYRTKMQPMNYANILGISPQTYVPEGGLPAVNIAEDMQTTNVAPEQNIIMQGIASLPQVAPAQKTMTLATPKPKPTPTPAPKPAPAPTLQELLTNIGVDPSYFNMYTQGRGPTDHELDGSESGAGGSGSRDLGEQYSDPGMPSFLGFTGDLGATTGRTISVDSNTGDDVIRRAETYQDVFNAYRSHRNSLEQP